MKLTISQVEEMRTRLSQVDPETGRKYTKKKVAQNNLTLKALKHEGEAQVQEHVNGILVGVSFPGILTCTARVLS